MMWAGAVQPGQFVQVCIHLIVVTSRLFAAIVVPDQKVVTILERPLHFELERLITIGLVALECLVNPTILWIRPEESLGRNSYPVAVLTGEDSGREVIVEGI